ncbi:MAG: hypothetical protein HY748_00055 [Elusimicrobia bacterium]|nr:hypothetical protein [Elusimicrobiota bacterium]
MRRSIKTVRFDLAQTMECGQFFNWLRLERGYRIRAHGRVFDVRQEGDRLLFSGADHAFIRRFFALGHDPEAIRASMPRDSWLDQAFAACGRLRLLRQDPWECLVAFLLSPVSNIPRIQRNLISVYEATGFDPGRMNDEALLRSLGLGFRWRFLASAARQAGARGRTAAARRAPGAPRGAGGPFGTTESVEGLDGILGFGPKVRDCVRLFGYGDMAAFPVDTWIRRVLRELYGVKLKDDGLRLWARRRFGPWSGYAQQWLFAWSREYPGLKAPKGSG